MRKLKASSGQRTGLRRPVPSLSQTVSEGCTAGSRSDRAASFLIQPAALIFCNLHLTWAAGAGGRRPSHLRCNRRPLIRDRKCANYLSVTVTAGKLRAPLCFPELYEMLVWGQEGTRLQPTLPVCGCDSEVNTSKRHLLWPVCVHVRWGIAFVANRHFSLRDTWLN